MDLEGRILDVARDYITRKPVVSFLLDADPNGIEDLQDTDLTIVVKKYRKKRSLDSNAYFHVLCDKLRQKLGISMAACKNHLIVWYGQIEYIEPGQALIYKTNAPPEYVNELEEAHMEFLKQAEDGGYFYRVYRGSHTYDSKEMAKLIDGTVQECKDQGIETLAPEAIERMNMEWQLKH